jgi:hypothetical protein
MGASAGTTEIATEEAAFEFDRSGQEPAAATNEVVEPDDEDEEEDEEEEEETPVPTPTPTASTKPEKGAGDKKLKWSRTTEADEEDTGFSLE